MDVFQGLPSDTVPLCLTSWENQKKTAKTSTTANDLVKMLEETGTKVSISTVKRVLYQHNLKGSSARKMPLLQKCHKKARLQFATAHGDKDCNFGLIKKI